MQEAAHAPKREEWWRVMCLTGVDYFSSMGFQPGISFIAAGVLSPLATFQLILLTVLGALPAYWIVCKESPHGQGSFAIFERMLSGWMGKTLVLILLGFAATDFIFTITMCTADATAHIINNPLIPELLRRKVWITIALIVSLGAIFMKGFGEAIRISFWLVVVYLLVNVVTIGACIMKVFEQPFLMQGWQVAVHLQYGNAWNMFVASSLAFPQLALGMSGFETGVAVMPLIKTQAHSDNGPKTSAPGTDSATGAELEERIAKTRKLLCTVAGIMSVFLIVGSFVTTLLISPDLFQEGQPANGRALAYLTHLYLGEGFGTVYDLSTILILWFAGASGMAALLSLVPQYLPRYGMAPSWAGARRPLVLFFTIVSVLITIAFQADVDAQAGAFATGLLVMLTSAAVAVTAVVWNTSMTKRLTFCAISALFIYCSFIIMRSRPDGVLISLGFIAAVIISSIASRALRSTELRIGQVVLDEQAKQFVEQARKEHWRQVRLLAHRPGSTDYKKSERHARRAHSIQEEEGNFIFLEIATHDVSDFREEKIEITGHTVDGYQILRCSCLSVPNAIAAILLHIRDTGDGTPHVYFGWTEGHPLTYVVKYILLGEGETAPVCREILRRAEPDPEKRPMVHVS